MLDVVVTTTGEVDATRILIIGALLERLRGLRAGSEEGMEFMSGWLPLDGGGSTSIIGYRATDVDVPARQTFIIHINDSTSVIQLLCHVILLKT